MFSGVVRDTGYVKKLTKTGENTLVLEIQSKKTKLILGSSISVNGVCLTVTKKTTTGFLVDIVKETLLHTNLGKLCVGDQVNLEPSLKIGDSLDGHFVTGHIDACGKILKNGDEPSVLFPSKLRPFVAKKGSITINGVSLTVADVKDTILTIALIPFTKTHTNLGLLRKGDLVNIEVDILARYLYNF
jgi:riboflavin synthase